MPRDSAGRELRFSAEDVASFAAASGDHNPLHLDPSFARATPFGSCVVHGALVALGLLGALPSDNLRRARALSLRFAGPALPEHSYAVEILPVRGAAREARLIGRGQTLARVLAAPDPGTVGRALAPEALLAEISEQAISEEAMLTAPLTPAEHEIISGEYRSGGYRTGPELAQLAERLGAQALAQELLEALAWASYAVGMQLPGLHSLLAGITLVAPGPGRGQAARQAVRVREHDGRTGQLILDGALCGSDGEVLSVARIDCFWQEPPASAEPDPLPATGASSGPGPVTVIGASRGFGAALALELLACGYPVHAAYSTSSAGAQALARRSGGQRDSLHLHRLDAGDPDSVKELAGALAGEAPLAGIVLCAAPPPLPMGLTADAAVELSDYVADSVRLAAVPLGALLPLLRPDGWVLFCSTSALEAPPRDWPHYVSAKAAIEGLARWIAARAPRARTVVLRPPAMRTDMTNTPSGRIAAVNPGPVAAWTVERLTDGHLPAGMSVLTPGVPARVGA